MPARLNAGIAATLFAILATLASEDVGAQQTLPIDPSHLAGLSWRAIGPSWPDARLARISTDAAFPYRVCAPVAGRGALCGPSRGGDTATTTWMAPAPGVDGALTPDPLDADILYSDQLVRIDRRTNQATLVSPELVDELRTPTDARAALTFSADGRTLFAGIRSVWRTVNGGLAWTAISQGLTASPSARITSLVISPIDARTMWAGTSDGRLHLTRDAGVTWTVATPPAENEPAVVSIELSRFDTNTVYVSVRTARGIGLFRSRNSGLSWVEISRSLPAPTDVFAVREDAQRRGLLVAATSRSVFVSIDDGDRWQSLQLNLPAVPVGDLVIRDADLVIATDGNGAWVLDDFSPLRQITADLARADAFLFRPAQTWRVRAQATPTPASIDADSAGDGVWLSYLVGPSLSGPVTIEVIETVTGDLIRRFSSEPSGQQPGEPLIDRTPGLHRVHWDLRYTRPEADPAAPGGARVLPGTYQVRLTASGRSIRQAVAVRVDPRIRATQPDLTAQRTLARQVDNKRAEVARALPDAATGSSPATRALLDVRDELRRVARAITDADVKPSSALETAAAAAIARATSALASDAAR